MLLLENLIGKDQVPQESRLYSLWETSPWPEQTVISLGLTFPKYKGKARKQEKENNVGFKCL